MKQLSPWSTALLLIPLISLAVAGDPGFSEQDMQRIDRDFGTQARERVAAWREMIAAGRDVQEAQKLELVNRFFNQVRFVDDTDHWGEPDYWASPLETLTSNGGDCEDISIAKYFALREMGVADQRLRLTYVKALDLNQAHMVLTYFPEPGAEPLVLDNLVTEIRPAPQRPDLLPVYSFNGDGLWLAKERAAGKRVGGSERIGLWRNLLRRMRERSKLEGKPDTGSDPAQTR